MTMKARGIGPLMASLGWTKFALAGIGLRFVATVVEIRPATSDEIEHGSADDASSVILRPLP